MAAAKPKFDASQQLATQLSTSAQREAQMAVAHLVAQEYDRFYIHAGAAIELATKAGLARLNVLLLLDGKHFDKGYETVLQGNLSPTSDLFTVGAAEGLKRLKRLAGTGPEALPPDIEALAEKIHRPRNTLIHTGQMHEVGHRSHSEAGTAFLTVLLALHRRARPTGTTHPNFDLFGSNFNEFVQARLDAAASEDEIATKRKLSHARERLKNLDPTQRETLVDAADRQAEKAEDTYEAREDGLDQVFVRCPACKSNGCIVGELFDDGEPDFDHGEICGWCPLVVVLAQEFSCPVCRLELVASEFKVVDLPVAPTHPTASQTDLADW